MSDNPTPENETAPPTPTPDTDPPVIDPATLSKDDKNMGMLAHLLGAFTGFLGPLIIWLVKKEDSAFVEQEGKESLNFQITILIIYVALVPISIITCGFGGILYLPLFVLVVVFSILGAMKAKEGIAYRYPFALRLIK